MNRLCTLAILSYNAREQLARALGSIRIFAPDYPLVVWDNASTEDTGETVRRLAPGARFLSCGTNLWFSGGCNALIRACETPYVLLMNADVFFEHPHTVEQLVEHIDADARLVAVTPSIRDKGMHRHAAHASMTPLLLAARDTFIGRPLRATSWYRRALCSHYAPTETFQAQKVTNSCCMFRRDAFLEMGGFDTRLILYFTEEEFGLRAQRLGYRQEVLGRCVVGHDHGSSTGSLDPTLIRGMYVRDRIVYLRTNFGYPAALVVEALMLARPRFWATLRDHRAVMTHREQVAAAARAAAGWAAFPQAHNTESSPPPAQR